MGTLDNPKHERFAQALFQGKSATDAYVIAGYRANDSNATRMNGNERIRSRVEELLRASAEKAVLNEAKVLDELGKLAFSNMLDFIQIGPDGQPYTNFSDLTRDQAAAIGEITVETRADTEIDAGERVPVPVRKVRFKLTAKTPALDLLGKHFGLWKERIEHTGKDGTPLERTVIILPANGRD